MFSHLIFNLFVLPCNKSLFREVFFFLLYFHICIVIMSTRLKFMRKAMIVKTYTFWALRKKPTKIELEAIPGSWQIPCRYFSKWARLSSTCAGVRDSNFLGGNFAVIRGPYSLRSLKWKTCTAQLLSNDHPQGNGEWLLAGDNVLCSSTRHFTLAVPLSTNLMLGVALQ